MEKFCHRLSQINVEVKSKGKNRRNLRIWDLQITND
jgi:hypothetical protein